MPSHEIDVRVIKDAVNAILDHLLDDLCVEKVTIEESTDLYWHCPSAEIFDMSKKPVGLDLGRLTDDADFVKLIKRGQGGDVSYTLVHVALLLRYIGEKIKG